MPFDAEFFEEDICLEVRSDIEKEMEQRIAQAKRDRDLHMQAKVTPYKVPLLWLRDRATGRTRLYGTDSHDSLYIGEGGGIQYYNLQNGCGTGEGGSYEFVDHDTDGMMYESILHYYLEGEDTEAFNQAITESLKAQIIEGLHQIHGQNHEFLNKVLTIVKLHRCNLERSESGDQGTVY